MTIMSGINYNFKIIKKLNQWSTKVKKDRENNILKYLSSNKLISWRSLNE